MIWWPIEVPTLVNGSLKLRPVMQSDIELIYEGCQDPIIPKFTTILPNYTIDMAKQYVNERIPQNFAKQTEIIFAVDFDKKFCGTFSLHTIDHHNHRAEVGYWIVKDMREKGVGTKAVELITEFGLMSVGFKRIEAMVDVENEASRKLLLNAGYEFEGILRQRVTNNDGKQIDMAVYAATRT